MQKADKKEYLKRWRAANPDKVAAGIARGLANRKAKWDDFLVRERHRYSQNKEAVSARQKARNQADPERRAEIVSKSYQKKKSAFVARNAARRAAKLNATPPWADMSEIAKIYEEARLLTVETGVPHEVDHIYPLQGKLVSGLHIALNLRVIPRHKNRSKGIKIDPDIASEQLEAQIIPAAVVELS